VKEAGKCAWGLVRSGILLNRIEFMDEYCTRSVNIAFGREYKELPTLIMEVVMFTFTLGWDVEEGSWVWG
jgi:hypothetical protein